MHLPPPSEPMSVELLEALRAGGYASPEDHPQFMRRADITDHTPMTFRFAGTPQMALAPYAPIGFKKTELGTYVALIVCKQCSTACCRQ